MPSSAFSMHVSGGLFYTHPTKVARWTGRLAFLRNPPHLGSTMTAVATNSGSSGNGAPKANTNGSGSAQLKAVSAEDAQAILSNIASKIHGSSSATATTGTSAGAKSGGNDGTEEVTGADLANLRAVAFDSEEGKKVSLGPAFVNCHR